VSLRTDDRRPRTGELLALTRGGGGRLVVAGLLGAGAVCAAVGLLATSAWLISRASQHPPVEVLAVAIVGVRFFGIARGVARYLERLVGHDAALRSLTGVRVRVYERLEQLAPAGLPAFRSGDLLARVVADVDALQDLPLRVLQPVLVALVAGAAVVGLLWWLLPAAGLLLAVLLVTAAVAVPAVTQALARRSEARLASARAELAHSVVDLLQGAPDLVAYGAAGDQLARTSAADADLTRSATASARTSGVGAGLAALLAGGAVWGAAVLGLAAVRDGRLAGVLLAVVVLTPLGAFEAVAALPLATQVLERVRRSGGRVLEVLRAPVPVADPVPAETVPAPAGVPPVRLSGVGATWPGAAEPALRGVDLDLAPGRRVAVVGPSGAGKSTLAAVLLRFLPYDGSVTLAGVELAALDGDAVRRYVGLCAQDAHVFDTTLEQNLRIARPDASAAEVRAALAAARLDGWVDSLPQGLATELGERGAATSGGQRQRIALARALLADFPVLLLDEPGEHLDVATADRLTADLLDATQGRTTVLVTHRLAGLDAVDEVVVLDRGTVVERGTHAELLAAGGTYAALWARERAHEAG
jgi:thiol reductant ABC exporter CydC subunit